MKYNTSYIPFETPKYSDYETWKNFYLIDLNRMYKIMLKNLSKNFSNEINNNFEKFCKFIYDNSSKNILEYR